MFLYTRWFNEFWNQHPALLYGVAALLGCGFLLGPWEGIFLALVALIAPLLAFPKENLNRLVRIIGVTSSFAILCAAKYTFPVLPPEGVSGWGKLEIVSFSTTEKFGKLWSLQCTLKEFTSIDGEQIAKNIPCGVYLPFKMERPTGNHRYSVYGRLKQGPFGGYKLSIKKKEPWKPYRSTLGIPELRNNAKQSVKAFIQFQIANPQSGGFLSGLATGDFEDSLLAFELGRFGLLHIMAISGFHFAIVAGILNLFLSFFLPKKTTAYVMILLMSSYFVFIGCGPSILRAWIMVVIALTSHLFEKESNSLNSLGLAILCMLIYDPILCRSIGFQFSTLSTAAILMFFGPLSCLLERAFKKRSIAKALKMNLPNQYGYCLLSLIRQGLALTLAVNAVAIPMMLYGFHRFPLMGLFYNLFFPFLISLSILLLFMSSCFLFLFPPFGKALFILTNHYTSFVLNTTTHMPTTLDYLFRVHSLNPLLLISYLIILFYLFIPLHRWHEEQIRLRRDLAFL